MGIRQESTQAGILYEYHTENATNKRLALPLNAEIKKNTYTDPNRTSQHNSQAKHLAPSKEKPKESNRMTPTSTATVHASSTAPTCHYHTDPARYLPESYPPTQAMCAEAAGQAALQHRHHPPPAGGGGGQRIGGVR